MVLSLAPVTNLPGLVSNKKKLDNETSESVDESLQTEKIWLKFITKTTKLTKNPYSFFLHLQKLSKNQKKRVKEKITFFLNNSPYLSLSLSQNFF